MKMAEEDQAQVHATLNLQREMGFHSALMQQSDDLFKNIGAAKLRTIKYASRLAECGHPVHPRMKEKVDLGPLVGFLDTTVYARSHEYLFEYFQEVTDLQYRVQRHYRILSDGSCLREAQETQQALESLSSAHSWVTEGHPKDLDAQEQLEYIITPGNRAYKDGKRVWQELAAYNAQKDRIEQRLAAATSTQGSRRKCTQESSSQSTTR